MCASKGMLGEILLKLYLSNLMMTAFVMISVSSSFLDPYISNMFALEYKVLAEGSFHDLDLG